MTTPNFLCIKKDARNSRRPYALSYTPYTNNLCGVFVRCVLLEKPAHQQVRHMGFRACIALAYLSKHSVAQSMVHGPHFGTLALSLLVYRRMHTDRLARTHASPMGTRPATGVTYRAATAAFTARGNIALGSLSSAGPIGIDFLWGKP
jgi:hypothetical protein